MHINNKLHVSVITIFGGDVAEWLGRWTSNLMVPGSSPIPCY